MEISAVEIVPFQASYQPGIDQLFQSIQAEFTDQVFPDPSASITTLSAAANRKYWVALANEKVIGTVGIIILNVGCCGLKSMFVAKDFRGGIQGIAHRLLDTAIKGASGFGCRKIYLGTMKQFSAAQRFYEKHGFLQTTDEELPADFPANMVDTVFYTKTL